MVANIGKTEVPVAFAPVPKGHKADNMKEFFKDIKRYITDNAEDSSGDASLDEILEKVDDEDESAWDPTGTMLEITYFNQKAFTKINQFRVHLF